MATTTAPTFFVDVTNFTFVPNGGGSGTTLSLFGIKSVSLSRDPVILFGKENNKQRAVSSHTVEINDGISVDSEDGNGLELLLAVVTPGTVAFNWRAAAHNQIAGSQLADQTVTITNVQWTKKSLNQGSKSFGTIKLSGVILENSAGDGTDPVTFTTTSSPPSDTAN